MTEATKVQCAVVIEKDTERGTVTVTPPQAKADPQVAAALARFNATPVDAANNGITKIVPAWAPAGSPTSEVKLPEPRSPALPEPVAPPVDETAATDADAAPTPPAAAPAAAGKVQPKAEQKLAMITAPPPKRTAAKPVEKKPAGKVRPVKATKPGQCRSGATAKWYTTAEGKKKYRCVKPTGDAAPEQLY